MSFEIRKATKTNAKLRLGLVGPAGSGKTYSALLIARTLGGRTVVIDTENASSEKYADIFDFDVLPLEAPYEPKRFVQAIKFCEEQGYDIIIVDSVSHAWAGIGGVLEMVDNIKARSRSGNAFTTGWRDVTPEHNKLVDALVNCKAHLVGCMRAKTEYVMETNPQTGKKEPRKVGMAPVQREGMDFEFDIVMDLDWENRAFISKSRCFPLKRKTFLVIDEEVAGTIAAWLTDGAESAPEPIAVAEEKPEIPHTQTELVKYAKEMDLDNTDVGKALKASGFKQFDASKWDEMVSAINGYKKDEQKNGK